LPSFDAWDDQRTSPKAAHTPKQIYWGGGSLDGGQVVFLPIFDDWWHQLTARMTIDRSFWVLRLVLTSNQDVGLGEWEAKRGQETALGVLPQLLG